MVNKVVLIAPAGLQTPSDMPFIAKFLALPFMHQFLMNQPYMRPILVRAVERFSQSTRVVESDLDHETEEIIQRITKIATYQFVNHPGFFRAFIGTAVEFPFTGLTKRYRKVGQHEDIPILIIWGDQDTVCIIYKKIINSWRILTSMSHRLFLSNVIKKRKSYFPSLN